MTETTHPSLAEMVRDPAILVAPGIYDALGALVAEQAGFRAAYLSGASIAYSRFGRPDIGLVDMGEVADTLAAICDRVGMRIIVDADTGFGNALNVARTVRRFEQAGAGAIQLEDQTLPKRCGHLKGKTLVSRAEMVGKIHAALDARRDTETLIVARTDAIAVEGLEPALDRAAAYAEAGADILFVEAPQSREAMRTVNSRLKGTPLLANMVEGGKTPLMPASDLEALGYSVVIFPGGLARAFTHMARAYFDSLHANGTTEPFLDRMLDFDELNVLIGTEAMLAEGASYDASRFDNTDSGENE